MDAADVQKTLLGISHAGGGVRSR